MDPDVSALLPSAEDITDDNSEDGVESLPTNNDNPNDQQDPENPNDEDQEGEEGKGKKEDQEDEDVPFHKHKRWIERTQEIKGLKESNQKLQERLDAIEGQKPSEPFKLNDNQRNELREILKGAPKHEFPEDFKTWGEAFDVLNEAMMENFIYLQSVFAQRAQSSQERESKAVAAEKSEFAQQVIDIEDGMDPAEFKEFRDFIVDELERAKKDPKFDALKFLNRAEVDFYKQRGSNKPPKSNPNKKIVSKVGGKGKPIIGDSGPDTKFIQNNDMGTIARTMMGG
ncbi:MAG: hypothetical protein ACP5NS_05105 [Candidatus Pacearchaeota archaeon]